jgi:hypothetical protein
MPENYDEELREAAERTDAARESGDVAAWQEASAAEQKLVNDAVAEAAAAEAEDQAERGADLEAGQ